MRHRNCLFSQLSAFLVFVHLAFNASLVRKTVGRLLPFMPAGFRRYDWSFDLRRSFLGPFGFRRSLFAHHAPSTCMATLTADQQTSRYDCRREDVQPRLEYLLVYDVQLLIVEHFHCAHSFGVRSEAASENLVCLGVRRENEVIVSEKQRALMELVIPRAIQV